MDGPKGSGQATAQHRTPRRAPDESIRPALICCHPRYVAVDLPDELVVGRDWLAACGITDPEASGRHAQIRRAGGAYCVADGGSTNGTWVEGQRLAPGESVELADGAVLRIGSSVLVFRERFDGPLRPSTALGAMIAPFGMRAVEQLVEGFARHSPHTVLVEGETGTGKELMSRFIAERLGRADPYGAVNVAAVPAGVFDAQLFGHVAGAFSDARNAADGVVVRHDGGAVFLDEIGELPAELQPKLLRLLENREVLAVGASAPRRVDVLVIAATNRSLDDMASAGTFRADLVARLKRAQVMLPPLRERREDIVAIAREIAPTSGLDLAGDIEVEAVERLVLDPWPHNVRGLSNVLSRIAALDHEPGLHQWAVDRVLGPAPAFRAGQLTRAAVEAALAASGGNESQAAEKLAVSRGKLRRFRGKA